MQRVLPVLFAASPCGVGADVDGRLDLRGGWYRELTGETLGLARHELRCG
jgi:hypothetical protein